MKLKKTGLVFILGVLAIVIALYCLSALIIMLLANVVLEHYGIKTLDFGASLAVTALLAMVTGGARAGSNND